MASYDLNLQASIDAASVAKDAGATADLRELLIRELAQRDIETSDEAWLSMVVEGIRRDPNFMTSDEPADFSRG